MNNGNKWVLMNDELYYRCLQCNNADEIFMSIPFHCEAAFANFPHHIN